MNEKKKASDERDLRKIKSPIKMPSNLEAVYDKGGNFIGRKPREPLIPEIAQTPEEYINILSKSEHSIQTRFHVLTSFIMLHEVELPMLLSIPGEKLQEIIDYLPSDDLMFLLGRLREVKSDIIIPLINLTAKKILSQSDCEDWMRDEVSKVSEERKLESR